MRQGDFSDVAVEAGIDDTSVESLIVYLLRDEAVRQRALNSLDYGHFTEPNERHFAILWLAVQWLVNNNMPVTYHSVRSRIAFLVGENPSSLTNNEKLDLLSNPDRGGACSGIVYHAFYENQPDQLPTEFGLPLLANFLQQRHVVRPLQNYMATIGGNAVADVSTFLDLLQRRHDVVGSICRDGVISTDISNFKPLGIAGVSSGFEHWDALTDGGPAKQELTTVLSPTNSGKTTNAISLVSQSSLRFRHETPDHYAYYFGYEDSPELVLAKFYSYVAKVDRRRIEQARSWTELSTADTRQKYEEDLNLEGGEQERLLRYVPPAQERLRLLDWRGPEGSGGADAIVSFLRREAAAGRKPGVVVIDWAGLLVLKWQMSRSSSRDLDRENARLLNTLPTVLKEKVGIPFDVPIYLFHQVKGETNKKIAGARFSHTDALGAKSMGTVSDFCILMDKIDEETKVAVWTTDKAKRGDVVGKHVLVRLDGQLSRFVRADESFSIDPITKRVVARNLLEEIHGAANSATGHGRGQRQRNLHVRGRIVADSVDQAAPWPAP